MPCWVTGLSDTCSFVPRATPCAAVVPMEDVKVERVSIICLGTAEDGRPAAASDGIFN